MSSRTSTVQVKQVLKKIVDEVVENSKESDVLSESSQAESQVDDNEVRRSGRARKQPDRLAPKKEAPKVKKKKEEPFTCEIVMDPAPADLRGILKPARRSTDAPPRKSSLNATAGKAIIKKYRKVRIKRLLKFKVIPPLPGWREDRTRMPDDEVDEEEQQRLEAQNQQLQLEEAQKIKKKKRKSIGVTSVRSESEDDSVAGGAGSGAGEEMANSDIPAPQSPDVFYEAYMKEGSPDSVLTTDREDSMDGMGNRPFTERRAPLTLFPPIEESPTDFSSGQGTVDDTAARPPEPPLVDAAAANKNRRRSVRIKAPEEEKKPAEKPRERRKSGMFPVTPLKEAPAKPAEKAAVRRRSGVIRSLKKDEEREKEEEVASTARIPWTDDPCRSDAQKAVDQVNIRKRKTAKVSAWLSRSDTVFDGGSSSANESGDKVPDRQWDKDSEEVEVARGSASLESQISERTDGGGGRVEETTAAKPDQQQQAAAAKRKGRRSMKFPPMGEEPVSKSSSKSSKSSKSESTSKNGSRGEEKKKPAHPFFAQFAPKPSPTVAAAPTATVAPPPPLEKKAGRRSMFVPKAAARKDSEDSSAGSEDVVEIVAEVTKAKRSREENESALPSSTTTTTTASAWRPLSTSEMDAAPFAGLVHVGRDEVEKEGKEGEEGGEGDGLVQKMRRLSVQLPRLSSYAIPASLRGSETADEQEMEPVFDEERKDGQSKRAGALAKRARALVAADEAAAAAQPYAWPEAMRPRRVSECVGDEEVLAAGKRWLHSWKKRLDAVCAEEERSTKSPKSKRKKRRGGNYSDESEREDSDSDYEVRDDDVRLPNPLVLSGPIGCGKSAYIRALSSEIGFSILESAPDEKRTGSNLRAKLAGAVANYRISKPAGGIASFFSAGGESGEKKEEEEGGQKKGQQHTLVVIEHIDVVFAEEDKLFWPALAEILTTTKIPIVLTCNVVPDELGRILQQVEAAGAAEPLEMVLEREGGRVQEYVEASLTGSIDRPLSATVIPALAARARADLRAALHDAHWAAAAGVIGKTDLCDSDARRVDEPTVCDAVAAQSFAWTDECARRRNAMRDSELSRAGEWPARGGMARDVYARLCKQIDEIDQDAVRLVAASAERAMEMARSGVSAGSGPRAGLVTRREIALDWMPVLEQMDRTEQEKRRVKGRRHQHYFNVIKDLESGASIDPLDRIKGACAFFRLP